MLKYSELVVGSLYQPNYSNLLVMDLNGNITETSSPFLVLEKNPHEYKILLNGKIAYLYNCVHNSEISFKKLTK